MSPTLLPQQVTDDQFRRYATLIYNRTGIRISAQKKTLLSNRLRRRLRATGVTCFDKYFNCLRKLPSNDNEWDAFLQEITTHETYLFRDKNQWDWFTTSYLDAIQHDTQRKLSRRSLRIWSAACSTGDEVFTIACCLADKLVNPSQWQVEIIGTDIGVGALMHAREAVFNERAMRLVPETYRRRFFTRTTDDQWEAKPVLKKWTSFRQHNLMDPLSLPTFDLILVKNVLIYFDPESKRRVMANIDRMLRPGGLLVNGPAEGVSEFVSQYQRIQPWLHQKPDPLKSQPT